MRVSLRNKAIRGDFVHAPVRGEIEVLADHVIRIGGDGMIVSVATAADGVPDGTLELPEPTSLGVLGLGLAGLLARRRRQA